MEAQVFTRSTLTRLYTVAWMVDYPLYGSIPTFYFGATVCHHTNGETGEKLEDVDEYTGEAIAKIRLDERPTEFPTTPEWLMDVITSGGIEAVEEAIFAMVNFRSVHARAYLRHVGMGDSETNLFLSIAEEQQREEREAAMAEEDAHLALDAWVQECEDEGYFDIDPEDFYPDHKDY